MILLALIVLGLCLGSFVNAFVWRLHENRDWVKERSECPHCHHVLAPKDLIPVISWLSLRGKCRYCHKPIPDSPAVELLVPVLFALSYLYWPVGFVGVSLFQFIVWLACVLLFTILAVYDLRWFLLPDKVVWPLTGLAVIYTAGTFIYTHDVQMLLGSLAGVVIISGLFYALYRISKEKWIGFGDVKLGISLGLLAGGAVEACMVLFFASFIGVIASLPLVATGKASRKTKLPFGPLLIAGIFIVQLFGAHILGWYLGVLGM
jgi:leader peptidase (prepilin peptidase)/N-methyltransferase